MRVNEKNQKKVKKMCKNQQIYAVNKKIVR